MVVFLSLTKRDRYPQSRVPDATCFGCLFRAVAAGFEERPTLEGLPESYRRKVIAKLPIDLPLELVGRLINDENYWQRRARALWRTCDVSAHGMSWKQLFFERYVSAVLEVFEDKGNGTS